MNATLKCILGLRPTLPSNVGAGGWCHGAISSLRDRYGTVRYKYCTYWLVLSFAVTSVKDESYDRGWCTLDVDPTESRETRFAMQDASSVLRN